MPKKKRLGSFGSPAERKMKYDGRGDVMVARERLKGALQDIFNSDEESSSSQEDPQKPSPAPSVKKERDVKPPIIRRRKRKAAVELELAFQHTFVMKLFDRSVDLAQFKEDTPLYPICRAWIANKPRMPLPYPTLDSPNIKSETEGMFDFDTEVIDDIHKLPAPVCPATNRLPPLHRPPLQGVSLDYSSNNLPTAEELLQEHLGRWGNIRRQWIEAGQNNEERFDNSGKVLANMYKRAQSAFNL